DGAPVRARPGWARDHCNIGTSVASARGLAGASPARVPWLRDRHAALRAGWAGRLLAPPRHAGGVDRAVAGLAAGWIAGADQSSSVLAVRLRRSNAVWGAPLLGWRSGSHPVGSTVRCGHRLANPVDRNSRGAVCARVAIRPAKGVAGGP